MRERGDATATMAGSAMPLEPQTVVPSALPEALAERFARVRTPVLRAVCSLLSAVLTVAGSAMVPTKAAGGRADGGERSEPPGKRQREAARPRESSNNGNNSAGSVGSVRDPTLHSQFQTEGNSDYPPTTTVGHPSPADQTLGKLRRHRAR